MEETAKRNPRQRGAMLPWAVAGLSTAIALLAIALAWRQSARADAGNAAGTDPALQQEIANLRQSDRISRQAVLALQDTLTERDEQVAALRADLDFYERFVSPDVQRRGLSVHAAHVEAQAPGVWRYELTLTQGREQPGASQGTLTLAVDGTRNGRLQQLDWNALRQQSPARPQPYQLRYLQRIDGEIALPPGFTPTRLRVKLVPRQGKPLEAAFEWRDIANA